jgi:hypothetical protein
VFGKRVRPAEKGFQQFGDAGWVHSSESQIVDGGLEIRRCQRVASSLMETNSPQHGGAKVMPADYWANLFSPQSG